MPEKWLDISGMIASEQSLGKLLDAIASGSCNSLDKVREGLEEIHASYEEEAWRWTTHILAERFGIDVSRISTDQLLDLVSKWESETIKLDKMILGDASKEFDDSSKIGFGLDGDKEVRDRDFEAVRGDLEGRVFRH